MQGQDFIMSVRGILRKMEILSWTVEIYYDRLRFYYDDSL